MSGRLIRFPAPPEGDSDRVLLSAVSPRGGAPFEVSKVVDGKDLPPTGPERNRAALERALFPPLEAALARRFLESMGYEVRAEAVDTATDTRVLMAHGGAGRLPLEVSIVAGPPGHGRLAIVRLRAGARACARCRDALVVGREGPLCGECLAPTERGELGPQARGWQSEHRHRSEGQRAKLGRTTT